MGRIIDWMVARSHARMVKAEKKYNAPHDPNCLYCKRAMIKELNEL